MFVTEQADFSAGMHRGRRAPENAFYDGVNVLLNDEGEPFKRGGSAFLSNADHGGALMSVYDVDLVAAQRTVALSASRLYALNGTTPVDVTAVSGGVLRAVSIGGMLVIPTPAGAFFYGGSLKTADYSNGAVTTSVGSRTVTGLYLGLATPFAANVDPGMVLFVDAPARIVGVVESAVNGELTLRDAAGVSAASSAYTLARGRLQSNLLLGVATTLTDPSSVAVAGTRLIVTKGDRAYFSAPGDPGSFDLTADYHELGSVILGSQGIGATLLVFTTAGVWAVGNMDLDALDDFGNVQHTVTRTGGVILWGNAGLASFDNHHVVPGIEDVYLFSAEGSFQVISEGIRPLYRAYVQAGYRPGVAVVHRGHYLLPVLDGNGTALVDVLVCRLDRGFAWTRLSGHAAGAAYAERIGATTRSPKLYGISAQRVTDLTGIFTPTDSNRADATGPAPAFSLTTRDFDTGPGVKGGLLRHARLEYDLVAPSALATIAVSAAAGAEGAAFTVHSSTAPEADGGSKTWMLNRFGERVRLKFENSDATADLRLRRLELHMQESQRP